MPNIRVLTAGAAPSLRARFGDALSDADAELLAAGAQGCLLAVPRRLDDAARSLLGGAGIVVVPAGASTLLAATRGQLERARERTGGGDELVTALLEAVARAAAPAPALRLREHVLDLRAQARVMAIVNVTPDSFHERVGSAAGAVEKARAMVADGASLVDIGGQSYSAANAPISEDVERERVVPAVRAIVEAGIGVPLSIDTYRSSVASAALDAGAHLINDCSGLSDPRLPEVVARHGAGLVVMHLKGELNVRDRGAYVYHDALAEIVEFLHERTERAIAGGVARDAIAIDPGLEFGKEPETDLEILERFGELRALGYPILFASSRKSFIARVMGRAPAGLLIPSLATAAIGIGAGARLLRVHDVAETVQLARMLAAVAPERRRALPLADRMPRAEPAAGNHRSGRTV